MMRSVSGLYGVLRGTVGGTTCRSLSSAVPAVNKTLLGKLRKKTGFPFINCKKALEKFDNDITQAESWMRDQAQKEGWSKASKLQGRPMSQGLVSLLTARHSAVMVEVNCETDFVARNEKFHSLLSSITAACLKAGSSTGLNKILYDKDALSKVAMDTDTVSEAVVMAIGNIGENIAARRATFIKVPDDTRLSYYIHTAGNEPKTGKCIMGKYGALLSYQHMDECQASTIGEVGRQLCQHIVGMNPKSIGDADNDEPADNADMETRLVFQEYLLDPSLIVNDVLKEHGIKIMDFTRFECGEELSVEGS